MQGAYASSQLSKHLTLQTLCFSYFSADELMMFLHCWIHFSSKAAELRKYDSMVYVLCFSWGCELLRTVDDWICTFPAGFCISKRSNMRSRPCTFTCNWTVQWTVIFEHWMDSSLKKFILSSVTHHHVITNLLYMTWLDLYEKIYCGKIKKFTFGIVLVSFCNGFDSFIIWRHAIEPDCKMVKKWRKMQ